MERKGMKGKEETRALQIRFPVAIYGTLKERAKKSRRSLNAEVNFIIELYLGLRKEGA